MGLIKATKNIYLLAGMSVCFTACNIQKRQNDGHSDLTAEVRPLNPIAPQGVYIADPEVRQMPDGRIYVYGSRDEPGNARCSRSYNILSSSDLVNWQMEQTSFATSGMGKQTDYTEDVLYAPDCIFHNG